MAHDSPMKCTVLHTPDWLFHLLEFFPGPDTDHNVLC